MLSIFVFKGTEFFRSLDQLSSNMSHILDLGNYFSMIRFKLNTLHKILHTW